MKNITMNVPLTAPYKYKSEPYKEYFSSGDWVKASLDFLGGKGKIGEFRYAPLIGTDIASVYVKNAKDRITLIKEYIEPVFSGDDI